LSVEITVSPVVLMTRDIMTRQTESHYKTRMWQWERRNVLIASH